METRKTRRLNKGLILVALFWLAFAVIWLIEKNYYVCAGSFFYAVFLIFESFRNVLLKRRNRRLLNAVRWLLLLAATGGGVLVILHLVKVI